MTFLSVVSFLMIMAIPVESRTNEEKVDAKIKKFFPKQTISFGIYIVATNKVSDTDLNRAASIMDQWIDNDFDGKVDNVKVHNILVGKKSKRKSFMLMDDTFNNLESTFDKLDKSMGGSVADYFFDNYNMMWLGADEPEWAYLEESLHLITQGGYAGAYRKVFGERKGTKLAKAMDKARGGYFKKVPKNYPKKAWYHYDDKTCGYACQITEYLWWGVSSLIGVTKNRNDVNDVKNEWELTTPKKK